MKCEMTLTRTLRGFTNITIETPTGTRLLVNLVGKSKDVNKKLLYKLICEYEEYNKEQKDAEGTSKKSK